MRNVSWVLAVFVVWGCNESNEFKKNDFTGNELVYELQAGSVYNIYGTVTFKEKVGGSTLAEIQLSGTENGGVHPVHLHYGNLSTPDAAIALLLNPIVGSTGKSETTITSLADESSITYNDLKDLSACIKIHLSEAGANSTIILAGGNIGNSAIEEPAGRISISVCKSE